MQSEPEHRSPVLPGMLYCVGCRSRQLRLSHLRVRDLGRILLFTIPMRCQRCGQRQYVSPLSAFLTAGLPKRKRKSRARPSWASWTERVRENEPLAMPATTAQLQPRESRQADQPQPGKPKDELW